MIDSQIYSKIGFTTVWQGYFAGGKLYFAGGKLYFAGGKLYFAGGKLYFAGGKLYFAGGKLYFAGGKLYFAGGNHTCYSWKLSLPLPPGGGIVFTSCEFVKSIPPPPLKFDV